MKKSDIKFETLRKSYVKPIVVGIVVFVVVMSVLMLRGTMAKYVYKQSVKLAEGTINYKMPDFNLLALNIQDESGEYVSASTVPSEGYTLNEEKSYCEKLEIDGTRTTLSDVTIEYKDGKLYFGKVTQNGTKCYVYFDKEISAKDTILANVTLATDTPSYANTSCEANTNCSNKSSCTTSCGEATNGIYATTDSDGTTYYYRGTVDNNWVKFAGFYWRIIRINGDGSIRLIYNGTTAGATGSSAQLSSTSAFNSSYNNNMYVGFMYTSGSVHGLGTSSTIKGVLDTWYTSNLASYASYIDTNAGFCGDRTPSTSSSSSNGSGGTGTTTTYYGAYIRAYSTYTPTYECPSEDLYAVSSSTQGNKALTNPIGLISADEVMYAGGKGGTSNYGYWLYTGSYYWTMSPYNAAPDGYAYVFSVDSYGRLNFGSHVGNSSGVRPVINLKADTTFTGDGTINSPYQVV